ncbi:hypothetical protein RM844_25825 [Streptomyces sp. DSM 44915]|uniref:Integral membrane protein n=1 Tax=Streptomyces chisholmiae TaxID=3075540 RepID=A0ABU2JXX9_9ACTN|nr:hypothetical protein [Streptomyces sp. DSM 44915]MDT0269707.1 hypothetical protein [Streptomyces sp. DSM 44915]
MEVSGPVQTFARLLRGAVMADLAFALTTVAAFLVVALVAKGVTRL